MKYFKTIMIKMIAICCLLTFLSHVRMMEQKMIKRQLLKHFQKCGYLKTLVYQEDSGLSPVS